MTITVPVPVDLSRLAVGEELMLIVIWEQGTGFAGGQVNVAGAVADHLRQAVRNAIERFGGKEPRTYSPDMALEDEEVLVTVDADLVADSPLATVVVPTAPPQLIAAGSLPTRPLKMYAVTIRSEDQGLISFVRKASPRPTAKAGHMLALLGDTLTRIGGPVFSLADNFDLIVSEQGVMALDQRQFEILFRETPALQARVPEWVADIDKHVTFAGDGAQRLAARAQTDGRLRRRIRSIVERDHLKGVTIDKIRAHIAASGLVESNFLDGDKLIVDDANPFQLVYLLNEDFFQGGLTDMAFRSDRKSPR
jgi:Kiwa KwaB-like protein